jgi:hypothetical protein
MIFFCWCNLHDFEPGLSWFGLEDNCTSLWIDCHGIAKAVRIILDCPAVQITRWLIMRIESSVRLRMEESPDLVFISKKCESKLVLVPSVHIAIETGMIYST